MNTIQTEHKGYRIEYWEQSEDWGCEIVPKRYKTLKEVKAKIDAFIKSESAFRAMPCLLFDHGWNTMEIIEGTVTSVTEDGEFWVTNTKKQRQKTKKAYAKTEENIKITKRLGEINEEIKKLREESSTLLINMVPIKINA